MARIRLAFSGSNLWFLHFCFTLFLSNTPGKCSPDRRYHEWSYTRQIAAAIVRQLKYSGYDADLLVPEDYDVSLRARVERVNTWCRQLGKRNVCLVYIHTNAAALSENLFHDNVDDLAFLESALGRQAIIDLHVRAIIRYLSL